MILKEVQALVLAQVHITVPVNPVFTTFQVKIGYIEFQVNIATIGVQVIQNFSIKFKIQNFSLIFNFKHSDSRIFSQSHKFLQICPKVFQFFSQKHYSLDQILIF